VINKTVSAYKKMSGTALFKSCTDGSVLLQPLLARGKRELIIIVATKLTDVSTGNSIGGYI